MFILLENSVILWMTETVLNFCYYFLVSAAGDKFCIYSSIYSCAHTKRTKNREKRPWPFSAEISGLVAFWLRACVRIAVERHMASNGVAIDFPSAWTPWTSSGYKYLRFMFDLTNWNVHSFAIWLIANGNLPPLNDIELLNTFFRLAVTLRISTTCISYSLFCFHWHRNGDTLSMPWSKRRSVFSIAANESVMLFFSLIHFDRGNTQPIPVKGKYVLLLFASPSVHRSKFPCFCFHDGHHSVVSFMQKRGDKVYQRCSVHRLSTDYHLWESGRYVTWCREAFAGADKMVNVDVHTISPLQRKLPLSLIHSGRNCRYDRVFVCAADNVSRQ